MGKFRCSYRKNSEIFPSGFESKFRNFGYVFVATDSKLQSRIFRKDQKFFFSFKFGKIWKKENFKIIQKF